MQLRWVASFSASCLHAAYSLARGQRLTDEKLAAALGAAFDEFHRELPELAAADSPLWPHLCGRAAQFENNRELAQVALVKAIGRERAEMYVDKLARHIGAFEAALRTARPELIDELEHRGRPLMEQWEARGPGMLRIIEGLTEPGFLAEEAEVILVHPVCGGGGLAARMSNAVLLEALLVNSDERLPEVARLAWLLAQLQLDLPKYTEPLASATREQVGAWALALVVLSAAEQVELARADRETLALALRAWHVDDNTRDSLADTLWQWWEVYQSRRPRWPAALVALERMSAVP